jgi:hypothetical protein
MGRYSLTKTFWYLYYHEVEEGKRRTGEGEVPKGWVIYRPEEPLYERVPLCAYLSNLSALFDVNPEGVSENDDKST